MPLRRCIEVDCLELTARTRCPEHQRDYKLRRGYTNEYRLRHIHARKRLDPIVKSGAAVCSRCHEPLDPRLPYEADERPWGFEPAHPACNSRAGAYHQP